MSRSDPDPDHGRFHLLLAYWATAKATTDESEWDKETLSVFPAAALAASPWRST